MRYNGAQTNTIEAVWRSNDFTGKNKPTARCTIHKGNVRLTNGYPYGDFASIIFSVGAEMNSAGYYVYFPRELPYVKSVSWNRDVDNDVASATIVLYNAEVNEVTGYDIPGFLTWNRGDSSFDKRFPLRQRNRWYGMIVPDNVIRTYEGYGVDYDVGPEQDPHMLCTGNWLIDTVEYNGPEITIQARDFGRILMDQILFPPITPRSSPIPGIQYPISFASHQPTTYASDYNTIFTLLDDHSDSELLGPDGGTEGHYPAQAFDATPDTYWLSLTGAAFPWIQGKIGGEATGSVTMQALYANQRCFVSVHSRSQGWMGSGNVNGIPYVTSFTTTGQSQLAKFGVVEDANLVRLTFTNTGGSTGVRNFEVNTTLSGPSYLTSFSNYDDFTDIIKLFCAWGGFHWPKDGPYLAVSKAPGFDKGVAFTVYANPRNDNFLKNGRIWGDLEQTGTWGSAPLTVDQFDKKTIMEGIQVIRQTVNFLFYIDETAGVQWRSPNYFNRGNLINGQRVQRFVRVLDTQTLQDITVRLDSKNARERVYVASPDGKSVGGARGYNLNPIGLRRIAGWIDENWSDSRDCQTAAQFTAMAAMMTYRTASITIAGLPTMQIDDQIEIVDSMTGEGFLHYVRGISSSLQNDTGVYTFGVNTSWLGARAGTSEWMIDKYGALSSTANRLIDTYDVKRRDGAYDQFSTVTLG